MEEMNEKTEVVVEEFDVEEPIETPKVEEVKDVSAEKPIHERSNREIVEEASKKVESEAGSEDIKEEVDGGIKLPEKQPKKPKKEVVFEDEVDIEPPSRFKSKEKEAFSKADPILKNAFNRSIKELQGHATQVQQQAKAAIQEASGLLEVVKPFAADFAERGFSIPQGIAQLLGAQSKLVNPKTKDDTYVKLGMDIEPSREAWVKLGKHFGYLNREVEGEVSSSIDIENHPSYQNLVAKFNDLQKKVDPLYTQNVKTSNDAIQSASQSILAELNSVRNETDENGVYQYPRLHDDPEFVEKWKPLVSAIRRATGTSYSNAGRRAYLELEATDELSTEEGNTSKLPPRIRNENEAISERVRRASSSVRGRSSPSGGGGFQLPEKIPQKNLDIVRLASEMVQRGG